jgi:uncharacterized FAD-dependent dehydrogenase
MRFVPGTRLTLFVPLDDDEAAAVARAMPGGRVVRRSLDARKGRPIGWNLEVAVGELDEPELPAPRRVRADARVIVVGSGPCGTYAALRLVEAGARVTIVEAGKPVQPRRHDLAALTQRGQLDPESNYCFGEGGAGTFSDGKLYTRVKDRAAVRSVLRALVEHGAAESILVDSRPHVGSNQLPKILIATRTFLESRGCEYVWSDGVRDLIVRNGRVEGVRCASGRELVADAVVLAFGHSARPLYERLHALGVALESKGFAVGARIEHPQPLVDKLQYGRAFGHPKLPAAFYQLSTQVSGRGVWSFCMCPGGWLVDSSTEPEMLCSNGMSLSRRDSPFANSALVVNVEPRDYGDGPLAGLELQRSIERAGFVAGGGGFVAPAQRVGDFLARRPSENALPSSWRPRVRPGDVRGALPPFVGDAIAAALERWGRSMHGFAGADAQLVGVETRSSSPVRLLRGEDLASPSHAGLYPAGEGAGWAGGIVSAAIDGLRVADAVIARLIQ